jgi:hypothetical protein
MTSEQQSVLNKTRTVAEGSPTTKPSGEMFCPPAVGDIPELSKESLLKMLR